MYSLECFHIPQTETNRDTHTHTSGAAMSTANYHSSVLQVPPMALQEDKETFANIHFLHQQ